MLSREDRVEHLPLPTMMLTQGGYEAGAQDQSISPVLCVSERQKEIESTLVVHTLEMEQFLRRYAGLERQCAAKPKGQIHRVVLPKNQGRLV